MSRGPTTFRQRDVSAAIKAARDAGCEVYRVEIGKDGKISIVTSRELIATSPEPNPWDVVLTEAQQ